MILILNQIEIDLLKKIELKRYNRNLSVEWNYVNHEQIIKIDLGKDGDLIGSVDFYVRELAKTIVFEDIEDVKNGFWIWNNLMDKFDLKDYKFDEHGNKGLKKMMTNFEYFDKFEEAYSEFWEICKITNKIPSEKLFFTWLKEERFPEMSVDVAEDNDVVAGAICKYCKYFRNGDCLKLRVKTFETDVCKHYDQK